MPHRLTLFHEPLSSHLRHWELLLTILGVVLLTIGLGGSYLLVRSFSGTFYPGTTINSLDVTGKTPTEVGEYFAQQTPPHYQVVFEINDIRLASSSAELGLHQEYQPIIDQAFAFDHSQPVSVKLGRVLGLLSPPKAWSTKWRYDQPALVAALTQLQQQINNPAIEPTASLGISGQVSSLKINPGKTGQSLDLVHAAKLIDDSISPAGDIHTIALVDAVRTIDPQLNEEQINSATQRARHLVGKSVIFTGDDQRLPLTDKQLVAFLAFPQGYRQDGLSEIIQSWATSVARLPQDAVLEYDKATLTVTRFTPPKNGLHLDTDAMQKNLLEILAAIETEKTDKKEWTAALPLALTPPNVTLAQTNDLGIETQVGFGESEYDHSIPSRIHNVALTSSKITNHIIKPGEEFSFNKTLGDVSAAAGFKPAYVIRNGQTELGDGGGVCQVSTTLFRAVLDAGLKVTKRRAHSYRVTYYELNQKPGFDATVYAGDVDLRFINDTPNHLLIHSVTDSKNLHMEVTLFGTSDGRTTEITDYQSWDARPAPPPVYTPDPTLAPGEIKQVDWAAPGIRTKFTNVVKDKNGQIIREDTYSSNYVPWSAKYLVGPT